MSLWNRLRNMRRRTPPAMPPARIYALPASRGERQEDMIAALVRARIRAAEDELAELQSDLGDR